MDDKLELLKSKFSEAYAIRFSNDDIDQKPTRYKDKSTGEFKNGKPLSYLNWAVAWRSFCQVYPDANYRVVETPDGSPLWNVNGFGMVKCAVSALGVEHVETFPIMEGGQNESVKMEEVDARDVNDSIQRGLTKAVARFGIGLYIYEGKIESKPQQESHGYESQEKPEQPKQVPAPSRKQKLMELFKTLDTAQAAAMLEWCRKKYGKGLADLTDELEIATTLTYCANAKAKADSLKPKEEPKEEPKTLKIDDDLPF